MALLQGNDIGRKIDDRWLWRGVSLALSPGDRLGLVGPTGTGKSLMLRSLAGLDPLDEGEITFGDRPLSAWNLPQYRSQVMYLHQRPVLFEGTVESNLKAVYQLSVYSKRHYDLERVLTVLDILKRPPEFLHKNAATLSGGESQIAAIVRALQLEPSILLLDEPTASLDPDTTKQVESAIAAWLESDSQRACIWTSHDPEQIRRVGDNCFNLGEYKK